MGFNSAFKVLKVTWVERNLGFSGKPQGSFI